MKKIKMTIVAAMFCAAAFAGYTAYEQTTMTDQERLMLANLDALTSGEFQTIYNRIDTPCTINVGVNGSIKLLGGAILTADTNGNITFDGNVICSSGGNSSCTPIECVDLYSVIFGE